MPYARSKPALRDDEEAALPAQPLFDLARGPAMEQREVVRLRALNARLLRELAALKEREAQAQHLADRDALTGLYNRRKLTELLGAAIDDAARRSELVGLLFIDLNGFKAINDEYGHAAGDKILTMVASRIGARVRAGDLVCRYGGDEFVVVLPCVPDAAAVAHVADTIRERLALPYRIESTEQHLTAAIGQSIFPRDGYDAGELLERADQAMYRLKTRVSRPMFSFGATIMESPLRRRGD
ncbi:MAG TPA: diguanylate cyclase [Steroidobacteraceae bacterium]|jgi:diguanylate cyclase (GGDEF)-like protein|nr:diguanylate cyclase [Steroidobacteraceae bacterium]